MTGRQGGADRAGVLFGNTGRSVVVRKLRKRREAACGLYDAAQEHTVSWFPHHGNSFSTSFTHLPSCVARNCSYGTDMLRVRTFCRSTENQCNQ